MRLRSTRNGISWSRLGGASPFIGGSTDGLSHAVLEQPAQARTFKVLYTCMGGSGGMYPTGALLLRAGTLYRTTEEGGTPGLGAIFQIDIKTHKETVRWAFDGGSEANATYFSTALHFWTNW